MKKIVILIALLSGFNCSSQNFEVKKIIEKPLVNKITDSSHIDYILNLIEDKTVSKFNENSFNLNSFFWSIKETFKTDELDKIKIIQSVNFDLPSEKDIHEKDSYVFQEWTFDKEKEAEESFMLLEKLKEKQLVHFPAPYNWKYFKYKNKIYFLYSFTLEPKDKIYKNLFIKIKKMNCFDAPSHEDKK